MQKTKLNRSRLCIPEECFKPVTHYVATLKHLATNTESEVTAPSLPQLQTSINIWLEDRKYVFLRIEKLETKVLDLSSIFSSQQWHWLGEE